MKRWTRPRLLAGFTLLEIGLWLASLAAVAASFAAAGFGDPRALAASLVGVTALIFIAKGRIPGQILTILFALLYAWISFDFRYYGEMITYLGMSAPIAAWTVIVWLRHPCRETASVAVARLSRRKLVLLLLATAAVTAGFGWLLAVLGTACLPVSIFSVTTSFLAAGLLLLRSPAYALAYAANDLVLIALWALALRTDRSALPMVVCFCMFLGNDLYGFFNWRRMRKAQETGTLT